MRLNLLAICQEPGGASESALGLRSCDGVHTLAQLLMNGVTWERKPVLSEFVSSSVKWK